MEIIINDHINRVRIEEALTRITNDTLNNLIVGLKIVLTDELTATNIYNDDFDIFPPSYLDGLVVDKIQEVLGMK
jgi:hypothetical protein